MIITLFTDCSFSQTLNRATWAVWFKYEGKTWRYSGALRGTIDQCGDGELAAIANGLYCIRRTLPLKPGHTQIICQTDSQEAIDAIRKGSHRRAYAQRTLDMIHAILSEHAIQLKLRHVKGHEGTKTPRNAVNTWCDKECRRQMGLLLAATSRAQAEGNASPTEPQLMLNLEETTDAQT